MNKHSMCPDENGVCQHAEDESCPAIARRDATSRIEEFPGQAVEEYRKAHGGALPGELQPCPFCGHDAAEYVTSYGRHAVRCQHCYSKSPETASQGGCRVVWNSRAPRSETAPPMLDELCKAFGWQGGTIHQALAEARRLKEIEHTAYHFLEMSEERISDKEVAVELPNEDYDKLCVLLGDAHPEMPARTEIGWISVKDQLPQERIRVLGANPLMVEVMYRDFGGDWCADNAVKLTVEHHKPTHWMPLPEAPHG